MYLAILFLVALGCMPSSQRDLQESPLSKCTIVAGDHTADYFHLKLGQMSDIHCPTGHTIVQFDVTQGRFNSDHINLTCLNPNKHSLQTCVVPVSRNYQYILTVGDGKNTLIFDLADECEGIPSCLGDEYTIWLWKNRAGASARCDFYQPNSSTVQIAEINLSSRDANFALAFQY